MNHIKIIEFIVSLSLNMKNSELWLVEKLV